MELLEHFVERLSVVRVLVVGRNRGQALDFISRADDTTSDGVRHLLRGLCKDLQARLVACQLVFLERTVAPVFPTQRSISALMAALRASLSSPAVGRV